MKFDNSTDVDQTCSLANACQELLDVLGNFQSRCFSQLKFAHATVLISGVVSLLFLVGLMLSKGQVSTEMILLVSGLIFFTGLIVGYTADYEVFLGEEVSDKFYLLYLEKAKHLPDLQSLFEGKKALSRRVASSELNGMMHKIQGEGALRLRQSDARTEFQKFGRGQKSL